MLRPVFSETSNAVDAGDAPPARPTSQRSSGVDFRSRASRLLAASEHSEYSVDSTTLMRMKSIELWDAEDRTHEESMDRPESSISVQDARFYANRVLNTLGGVSSRDVSPESAERTQASTSGFSDGNNNEDRQGTSSRKWVRNRSGLTVLAVLLVLLAIAIAAYSLALVNANQSDNAGATIPPFPMETTPPIDSGTDGSMSEARMEATMAFLARYSGSSLANLDDPLKPENMAATWIARDDTLAFKIPVSTQDIDFTSFLERYALAVYYFALNGSDWADKISFLDGTHVCEWKSTITLDDGEVVTYGITCNSAKEVTALLMPNNNMTGSLPGELALLKKLHFIDMNNNNIQGPIPDEYESLSQVHFFDVRHNHITGTIPDWIGNAWRNVGELALSFNNMTGTLPESLGNLTSIKTLTLAHNSFDSDLAPIQGLTTLEFLYLEGNQFRGTLDGTFLAQMPKLIQVDISSNRLGGQGLPFHLLQHSTLKVLDLCDNNINGPLPHLNSTNPVLQYLSLCDNALSGSLPRTISKLNKLTHLDLTNNDLTGEIPSSLATMQFLTYLFLSQNAFDKGPIPEFLSGMDRLRELSLADTQRTGTVPGAWLDLLDPLVLLDLSRNELTGTLPSQLWELPHLEYLFLNRNQLTGEIPSGITSSTNNHTNSLKVLVLDKNNITGTLTDACTVRTAMVIRHTPSRLLLSIVQIHRGRLCATAVCVVRTRMLVATMRFGI
ncbi:Leucine Rich Repeat [Fragilaria crotonensis]|nr:Leucine Rich Repeat [Fragilaria crotonensis]